MPINKQRHFLDLKKQSLEDDTIESSANIATLSKNIRKDQKVSNVAGKVACALLPVGALSLCLGVTPVGVALLGAAGLAVYDKFYAENNIKNATEEINKLEQRMANNNFKAGVISELEVALVQPRQIDSKLFGDEAEIHPAVNIDVSPKADATYAQVREYCEQKVYVESVAKAAQDAGLIGEIEKSTPKVDATQTVVQDEGTRETLPYEISLLPPEYNPHIDTTQIQE